GGTEIEGTHGTLTIFPDGTYTYTVNPNFDGQSGAQDVFAYTLTAPNGETETANLTITLDVPDTSEVASVEGADDDVVPLTDFAADEDSNFTAQASDSSEAPALDDSSADERPGLEGLLAESESTEEVEISDEFVSAFGEENAGDEAAQGLAVSADGSAEDTSTLVAYTPLVQADDDLANQSVSSY
ncbi:MAG: VCBS domain-containing protein, partial [Burkholderiaceae bacterium]